MAKLQLFDLGDRYQESYGYTIDNTFFEITIYL